MNAYGQIVLRQRALPLGRSYLQATWEGPRDGVVKVQRIALRHILGYEPKTFPPSLTVDGIRVRLAGEIENDFICDAATYVRADGSTIFLWLWIVVSGWAGRAFQAIYFRTVLTLMVWGLARVPQGQKPSWRHIGVRW